MSTASDEILGANDRISQLSESVIDEILFRLPRTREVAQTIVLSKTWLRILSTFPNLDFDQALYFYGDKYHWDTRDKLVNFVDNTIQRFHEHQLLIKRFKLYIQTADDMTPLGDKWVGMAVESKIEELCLHFEMQDKARYNLHLFLRPNLCRFLN
ncbi:hypothetical protein CFOL_v3_32932 [Cephalotus follicularis]|uniref:F-box domain-containing protein n=1 Tax=Cephalotus follicularis TaxID=3775 RepID=A0A1Q3DB69_CEPFO|nr:hypothetical protein CFOL_v3_32932 [Cephalotus follicularis]